MTNEIEETTFRKFIRVFFGLILGFLSGFLISIGISMLTSPPINRGLLIVGWAASTYMFLRKAQILSTVFTRGFLTGTIEWLLMIPIVTIFGKHNFSGDFVLSTFGFALVMTIFCLVGFGILYLVEESNS